MRMMVLALAASGFALSSTVAAQSQVTVAQFEGTRLDIVATGESTRIPDVATISAGVVSEAPTAQAALADNNRKMRAVFVALDRAGIEERDIRTARISLNPRYDRSTRGEPRLIGYQASNQLSVRFRDIDRAGIVIDALVGEGINQINGPSLSIDEPETALDEARRDAIGNARQRAELYASAAGMRVTRIVAISESGASRPPIVMRGRAMTMDQTEGASLQIAPGEQRLTASVSVTFELE